jgi:hypothetical protein
MVNLSKLFTRSAIRYFEAAAADGAYVWVAGHE